LPQAAEDYRKWFLGRLRIVEATLADREFLVAGRFTVADIAVGYGLMLAEILGLGADFGPNVQAYWARLKDRPGYRKAMDVQQRALKDQNVSAGVTL
jgi:glutathione S-transferase